MYVTVIAWPTNATASYTKWRLPALSFLRVFLVALPYNFSTSVFDAIAPTVATGRFAAVANTFQAFLGACCAAVYPRRCRMGCAVLCCAVGTVL